MPPKKNVAALFPNGRQPTAIRLDARIFDRGGDKGKKKKKPKRKKKNRKKPTLIQQLQEEKTPPSPLDFVQEELQSLKPSDSHEQIAFNEEGAEDKDEKKPDISISLISTSTLVAQPLPSEEEPSGLENTELSVDERKVIPSAEAKHLGSQFQQNINNDEENKKETETNTIAEFLESPKEELVGFIFELFGKARKIQARAEQLELENRILQEENERLKTRGN